MPQTNGVFPVYRLVLDAKPERVMLWLAEKRELAHGFSASNSINVSSETFCIKRKGFILFLFFS